MMLIELFGAFSILNSFDEIRFANSQKQIYDTSCGYASVATVLHNWYEEEVTEAELIEHSLKETSNTGFYTTSVKDLLEILTIHGYFAKAYRFDYDALVGAVDRYSPLIAHGNEDSGHFIVVLYADKEKLLISDPSYGTYVMYRSDFEKYFSGVAILVHNAYRDPDYEKLESMIAEAESRLELLHKAVLFL